MVVPCGVRSAIPAEAAREDGNTSGATRETNSVMADNPVIAFVFGQTGLMGDLSVQGSKITKLEP